MDTENNPHHSAASEAVVLHSPSSESGPTSSTESIRHTRDNDGFFKPLPVIKRSPHSRLSLPNIPLRSAKSAQSPYHHSLTSPRGSNIPVPSFRSTGIKSKRESNPSQPTPGTPCKRNPQNLFLSRHPPSRPQSEPQPRLYPHSFRNVVPPSPFGKSKSSDSIQTISLTPKDDDSPSSRVQFNSSNRSSRISSFNNSLQSSPIRNHPASGASAKLPFKRSKSFGSPKSLASNFPTSLVPLSSSRTNPNDQSGMDMPKEDSNENDEDEESDENSNLSPPLLVPPSPVSFPIQFKASTKLPVFGVRPFKQRPVKAHRLDRKYFLENSTLALNEDLSDTDPPDYFETTYTVLDTIGSGSFADVYRVRHIATGIEYALKATKKAYTGARDRSQKLEEVRTLWAVHGHPNCLQIYEAWEQQGHLYIVTEICPYGSLQAYLEQKATVSSSSPIAPNRTWHVLLDIISGLNYMHSLDIVHLDLKPANLLVSDDGNLKIADFGLSTKVPVSPTFNDDDRDGDNRYLAPEIYRQQYDKPADIFSLGLIMLEIITNSVLPDRGESYQRLRRGDLSDFLPQFPADSSQLLQSTIASMLNPIPSRRPTAKNILELKPIREVMAEKKMRRVSTLGNGKDLGKRFVGSWKSKSRMSFGRSNSFDNRGVVAVAPKATASPSPNSLEKMLGSSVNVSIPHSRNSTFGSVKSSSARWPNSSLNLNNSAVGNKPSPYELSIAVPRIETIENQNTLLVTPTEESFQSIDIMDISHGPQVVPPAVQADATDSSPADSTSTMENQTELPSKFPFTLSSSNLSPFAPTLQAPASLSSADSSQFIQPQFTPTSSQPNVFTTSTASHCLKIPDPTGTAKLISPFANVSPENLFARRSQEESFRDSDDDEIEDDKDTNSVCSDCEGGCVSQHGLKDERINVIDEDTREVAMDCEVDAEGCRRAEIMSETNDKQGNSETSKVCDSTDLFGHSSGSRQGDQTTGVTSGNGGNVSDEHAKMNIDSTSTRNANSNTLWTQFTTLSTCENGGHQATNEAVPDCSTTKQSPWPEKSSVSKFSKPSPFSTSTSSPFLSRHPPLSSLDSHTFSPTNKPSLQTTKNSLNGLMSPSPSTFAPTFGFHTQPRNQLYPRFQQSSSKPSSSSTLDLGTEVSPFSSPMVQPISFAASRIAPMSAPPANAGRTNNNLNCTDQNRFGCSFVPSGDQQCQSTGLNRSQISSFNFNDMSRTSTSLPISGMGILPRELPKRNENSFSRPSFLDTLRNSKDDDSSDDDEIVGAGGKKRINLFHGNSSISFINPKLQASKGISRDGETDDEFKSEDCNMGILRTRKLPLNETSVGTLNGESQNLEAGSGLTKCGVHKTQQGEQSKYPHGVNPRNDQIDEVTQFFTSPSSASRIHQAQTTPFSFSSSFPGAVSFSGTPASSHYSSSQKRKDRRRRDFSTDDSVTLMSQLPPDSISKSPNSSAFDTVFSPQSSNNPHSSLLVPTDSSNLELREKADFKEEDATNREAMKQSKNRETLANIVHSLDIISGDQSE